MALEHRLTPAAPAWVAQGPSPTINAQLEVSPNDDINGAIQSIAPQPGNANVMYAGTVNGGVWKTTNATAVSPTWTPLTDSMQSLSIGDIAFDLNDATSNTLIVGTGRVSNFAQRGDDEIGLYYTTNGGTSFSIFGDPLLVNQTFVGVGARGSTLLAGSTGAGLFRSTNTGSTWANISGINGLTAGGIADLVDDPTNLNRFYVAVHQVGVFRTTDGGANWTDVTAGLGGVAASATLRLAVNASSGVLYAAVPGTGAGASTQVFRSSNQGGTWTALDTIVVHPGGQQFRNTALAADPTNVNLAYLAGDRITGSPFTANAARVDASKASGSQWTSIVDGNASNTAPHADSRSMAFMADGTLLVSDDGGVYGLSTPTTTGGSWRSVGGNIQAMEIHDVAWNAINNTIVVGTQDNGSHQQPTSGSLTWDWFYGGDGGDVAVDSVSLAGSNQAVRYASFQNFSGIHRQVIDINGNPVGGSVALAGITGTQFVTPIEINTINPSRLLIGGSSALFESTDQGTSNTNIGGPGANRNAMVYGGTLSGVPNAELIYVGAGSQVFKRTVAAGPINATTALPAGASTITDVGIDPNNYNTVFAVDNNQVFFSSDGGTTWSDITGNLGTVSPGGIDLRTATYVNGVGPYASYVAVGTRAGVFMSQVGSLGTWTKLGSAMPDVLVFDLIHNASDNILVAGTLGRSVWTLSNANTQGETASTIVTTLADVATGDGFISLREAAYFANIQSGTDTVSFNIPAGGTITLASEIVISDSVFIDGPTAFNITVSGNNATRLFNVSGTGVLDVTFDQLTLTKGSAADGGAILSSNEKIAVLNCLVSNNNATAGEGGAIFINTGGELTVFNSTISGNTSSSNGGGVYFFQNGSLNVSASFIINNKSGGTGGGLYFFGAVSAGGFNLTNTTISGNSSAGHGGGIYLNNILGALNINNSSVRDNTSSADGGGLWTDSGSFNITNSTFSGNQGNSRGGGLFFVGSLGTTNIRNSTIANNKSNQFGGGVIFENITGTVNIQNTTISGNTATLGNGGGIASYKNAATINVESCIIAGNTSPSGADFQNSFNTMNVKNSAYQNTSGAFTNQGGNIVGPFANLLLGALANNGGPTQTMRPANASPLVNVGSNPGSLTADQRGVSRVLGAAADIGAVEVVQPSLVVINDNDSGAGSLRQAINDTNLDANTANTITFDPTFFATAKTINLTTGELSITDALLIQGPDVAARVTVKSNGTSRVFNTSDAAANTAITLQKMTISGGSAATGSGVQVGDESVTLFQVHVTGNTASGLFQGGAAAFVTTGGTLVVQSSTLSANSAVGSAVGGAILARDTANVTILNSTVSGNSGQNNGGGVYFEGFGSKLVVRNSTIVNNNSFVFPGNAGGLYVRFASANIQIESSVISDNSNNNIGQGLNPVFNISNSAIGTPNNFTFGTNTGNLIGQTLFLGPLQGNGGFGGPTHRPAGNSPLIDAGSNPGALGFDQTENFRTIGSAPDIGAVESRYLVVLNTNNTGAGSLRQTVQHGFSNDFNGTVTFDPTVFATPQTIKLATEILIADDVTINGPGADKATVSGNGVTRMFDVNGAGIITVNFSGLTLSGGSAATSGGAVRVDNEIVTLDGVAIRGNTSTASAAGSGGGGVAVALGQLTVTNSEISGNSSASDGGGIFCYNKNSILIRNTTISGNTAANRGGAFSGFAWTGDSSFTLQNSTVTNNKSTGDGGAFRVQAAAAFNIVSSVIAGNTGSAAAPEIAAGTVNFTNSLVGSALGHTLGTNTNNVPTGTPALLGPLALNGAKALQTHLPLPGSPLVDAGFNPTALTLDQRGQQRVVGTQIDIGAAEAVNLVVVNTNDAGSGSLRQTAEHANTVAGFDTITFDPTVFATPQTITLTADIDITRGATITGTGAANLTINAASVGRVFDLTVGFPLDPYVLSGMTLTGGSTTNGGAIAADDESVTLTDCVVTGNSASNRGGGIDISGGGTLTLTRTTVSNNTGQVGGGVSVLNGGSLTVIDCTFTGNQLTGASSQGAGLRFSGASASDVLTIRNTTIANNSSANIGGGVGLQTFTGTATIQNSTIVGNTAAGANGGGGIGQSNGSAGAITVESTIVSGNFATANSKEDFFSQGIVIANTSAIGTSVGITTFAPDATTTALLGQNFKLGALANNGGPTQTILPAIDSPLVGKGSNPAALTTDQRGAGFIRNFGGIDIGAIESRSLIVTNANDSGAGSLRQAVLDANAESGADTVTFDPAFFATPQIITLTSGEISISDAVTVTGPGAGLATVSGNNASRIFNTAAAANGTIISISGLTFTGGKSADGGAINVGEEDVTISNSVFTGNSSTGDGGAINVQSLGSSTLAKLTVVSSQISGNTATDDGGAIYINNGGDFSIINSTLSGNSAGGDGGGLYFFGNSKAFNTSIRQSTFSGNTAGNRGGGIVLLGSTGIGALTVQNSTIVNNSGAVTGGGISRSVGTMTIDATSSIISNNTSGSGPDIFTTGTANLTDCLLGSASGITTPNFSGSTAPLLGKAANLGPLASNGGPTQTHALLWTSPAIGQGSNPAALTQDQRGKTRVVGNIDIGAFELQPAAKVSGVVIGDGTSQRSMVTQLKVTFDSPVTFVGAPAAAFTLVRQSDSKVVNLNVVMDPTNTNATITFTGGAVDGKSLADGRYTLTGLAAQFGADGLDGDGNGTGGDDYVLASAATPNPPTNIFRLFGDSNGDGTVAANDFIQFRLALGGTSNIFDFDNDGAVAASDFIQFRLRFGGSI